MKGLEKILIAKKLVAVVVRDDIDIKNGINFFTKPNEPLQLALHSYNTKKETQIHHNKVAKPFNQTEKYKYIYMTKGAAEVELSLKSGQVVKIINLKRGDSVIIMDIFHKVIFAPKSRAIEIKQGPYEKT